ncbi:MAG TPA: hypothetical protein H9889_03850 [Candidatus Ignatzschineria merdigallinarum]|uniref:DUF3592 domain-containing protein n=1 Tax=Candidatus Ignatzschineria merdigallinarum TaxID=2838621 RepID=A0A9D1Q461_9GAMM|nr:hypothetical protein [Candidatus Ignatzschineria merdigallinarum]
MMPTIFHIPLRIKISFALYTVFFGGIGIIFLLLALSIQHGMTLLMAVILCTLGWFPVCLMIFKKHLKRQMLQVGEKVETTLLEVKPFNKGTFLGWQGHIVVTQWYDPEKNLLYHFKSAIISQDPRQWSEPLEQNFSIPVYVDRSAPKSRYYVDLSCWLSQCNARRIVAND